MRSGRELKPMAAPIEAGEFKLFRLTSVNGEM
jgi:hypothetical protein